MKRYQAIALIALLVAAGTVTESRAAAPAQPNHCSQAEAEQGQCNANKKVPRTCPYPNRSNSGFVGEDMNGDGKLDHIWRVYTSGSCAGETIGDALVIK